MAANDPAKKKAERARKRSPSERPPGPEILTPSTTRALLERLGHRPRKDWGQNFLVDGNIVRKSIELGRVSRGDRVVEVGPGLGTLTGALLAAGADVYAVERDPILAGFLLEELVPQAQGRLHLLQGDAVELPLGLLPMPVSTALDSVGWFKIIANLPYAISSPWMEAVLGGALPERMVLMLQREAAQRYAAEPGTKSFGAISVFLQAAFRIVDSHHVSRTCFFPVPDVDSLLIHLERRPEPASFLPETRLLVRTLFQHRRKQLAPQLRRLKPEVADAWLGTLSENGIRPDARPEDVPGASWIALDRILRG